jgi:hypothetical protein
MGCNCIQGTDIDFIPGDDEAADMDDINTGLVRKVWSELANKDTCFCLP